jgi:hypothetical protein
MKNFTESLGAALLVGVASASAQVTISPLSSFGGGDGWLAPGEGGYSFLGTANSPGALLS